MTDTFSFKQGSFILMWFFGTWTKPIIKCVRWIFVICVISSQGRVSYFPSRVTGHEQLLLEACFSNVCFKTLILLGLFSNFPCLWELMDVLYKICSFLKLRIIVSVFLLDEYFHFSTTSWEMFLFFELDPKESFTVMTVVVIQLTIVPSRKPDFYISFFDFLFPAL